MGSAGDHQYVCKTQEGFEPTWGAAPRGYLNPDAPVDSLVVGMGEIVPRWDNTPPRTLRYFVLNRTFPNNEYAEYAAVSMEGASKEWNDLNLGVTFTATTDRSTANFYVVYENSTPELRGVLASAFFPNEINQDITIYSFAFEPANRDIMQGVLLHELGHVLGLRHEHALEREQGSGAVRFMDVNPDSVMSYTHFPPVMRDTDITGTKAFYALDNGFLIGTQPVVDYEPQIRERFRRGK